MLEGLRDVAQHGEVHGAVLVVPIQVKEKVLFAFGVHGDGVVSPEDSLEVVGLFLSYVFNTKIIDAKGE